MFDCSISDFDNFDVVMKMNLLISAKNLCKELFDEEPLLEDDCSVAIDKLRMVINFLDETMH